MTISNTSSPFPIAVSFPPLVASVYCPQRGAGVSQSWGSCSWWTCSPDAPPDFRQVADSTPGGAGDLGIPLSGLPAAMFLDHPQHNFGNGIGHVGGHVGHEQMGFRMPEKGLTGA